MNLFVRKIIASSILVTFTVTNLSISHIYAKDTDSPDGESKKVEKIEVPREVRKTEKDHDLKTAFSGKKLERLKTSIKGRNNYTLLIRSSDGLGAIESFFRSENAKTHVKKVSDTAYLVELPLDNRSFSGELVKMDNDIIPSKLATYDVVQPEVFDAFAATSYLSGETLGSLWAMEKVGVPTFAEGLSTKGKIQVGVLDTGIDSTHTDLAGNYNAPLSYDFVNDQSGGIDDNGHGTEVAGVVGARVNGKWIFGSDPNADIVSLKVLNQDGLGTTYDVLEAIAYAKTNHIPVLNISFGGTGSPVGNPVCEAITDAKNSGTITVVSAGNASADAMNTIPAACPDAITVGATNRDDTRASFSNYGNGVDIYAPGVDIYTTALNNGYTTQNGTSFSAPLVAGLVAKELAYSGGIGYDQILSNITNNYHLVTNGTLANASSGGLSSTGALDFSGTTSSGITLSGGTLSGSVQTPIDYSTYHYYSGTFVQSGVTYGNSLYPDSLGFQTLQLPNVQVYTYAEYTNLLKTQQGAFKALSAPTNGLVAEYLFDGNANDTSGNGHNGTAVNINYGNGRFGQSANFNGTSSYVSFWNLISTPFTISVWVKPTNSNGIFRWIWETSIYYELVVYSGRIGTYGKLWAGYIWYTTNGTSIAPQTSVAPWSSDWQLVTTTFDWTNEKAYINGNLIHSSPGTWAYGYFNVWVSNWNDRYFNGSIDNLRVYNRSLSSSEIQALYNEWTSTISNNTQTTTPTFLTNQVLFNPLAKYDFTDTSSQVCVSNTKQQSNNTTTTDKNTQNAADPITLSKGEFTYDNTLMSIPGKKLPYEFKLSYKNQLYYNGPTWINWDHNYNMYLTGETNGNVLYYNGKLGVFRFTKSGSMFNYNEGLKANLVQSGSVYTINYDNGDKYTFNSTYNKVSQIADINGNNLNFTYSGGLLSTVTDTLGRNISYSYYDHNRLRDVTDFNGRKVTMNYFTSSTGSGSIYDLQSVTINNGTGATKTIGFEYSTGGTDTTNHAITKLIDAKGQVYVENTYDTGSRVTSQKYGSGTLTYTYTLSGSSITKNTVLDKLGNKTEYTYDANGNQTQVKYFNPAQTSSTIYTYEYDALGYMTKETKPRGNGFTYTYDARGNITEKRMKADTSAANSSNDLVTTYTYDANNNILTQTNPNGIGITNTYDTSNNLLSKTLSGVTSYSGLTSNIVTTYSYLSGFLNTTTDGEGNVTKFQYSSGQLSKIIRGTGSLSSTGSFVYDSYGNPTASTDGEGWAKNGAYNPFNLLSTGTTAEGIVTSYEYDANNNKTKETKYLSWGTTVKSVFFYDILDHMTGSLIDTASSKTILTTFKYDENGNIIEKKVGSGALVKYTYNEFGKVASERIMVNPNSSAEDIVTGYAYDTNGNLVSKVDALGNTMTYTYDLYDRAIQETNPKGTYTVFALNKDGSVSSRSVYSSGNVVVSKSAYLYDGLGNVVKSTDYLDPVNGTGVVETRVTYDRNGKKTSIIDPQGNATSNTYDMLGRLSSTIDALGNTVAYSYDKRDLVTSKTITSPPHPGPLLAGEGAVVVTTTSAYDHDGRLVSETDNLGQTKTLTYNALNQIVSSKDEANRVTNYERDYAGKATRETKYLSGGISVVTQYTYDERENLVSVTDANGNTTQYNYDGINRNTSVVYADGKSLSYVYDKNSNVVSQTDPNDAVVTNIYNTTNRLVKRTIAGHGFNPVSIKGVFREDYSYDAIDRPVVGKSTAILSSGAEQAHTVVFGYDWLGRLTNETQASSWQSPFTAHYSYDANGNRTSITSGSWYLANYSYDVLNRLTNVSYNSGNIANYTYSGILNTGVSYGNGVNTVQTFDGLLRLSSLAHSNGSGTIMSRTYAYDSVGNITSDGQKSYSYDTIDRLLSASVLSGVTVPNGSEVFGYDKVGNRTTANGLSYSGNVLNQYLSVTQSGSTSGSTAYSYDNNGNVVSNGVFTFGYDYKNRLVKVSSGSTVVAEYVYDVLGRRIQKKVWNETVSYVYSDKNILTETRIKSGSVFHKTYINGIGMDNLIAYDNEEVSLSMDEKAELAFCTAQVSSATGSFIKYGYQNIVDRCNSLSNSGSTIATNRYYFQKDHLGSIIGLTNNSWSLVAEYQYDVYGVAYARTGTGVFTKVDATNGNLYDNTRLFTGREYDTTVGLYYLRARYYDANVGRFISRDPIWQTDNLNLYTYVQSNPLRFTDPMGLGSKPAIEEHDATKLLLEYMQSGRQENTFNLVWRSSFQDSRYNIKYNQEFKKLAIDPNNDNKSCAKYHGAGSCLVYIEWQPVDLSQIGNFLIGYNFNYAWFTLKNEDGTFYNDIYAAGLFYETHLKQPTPQAALANEEGDRPWYSAGYNYAESNKQPNWISLKGAIGKASLQERKLQ